MFSPIISHLLLAAKVPLPPELTIVKHLASDKIMYMPPTIDLRQPLLVASVSVRPPEAKPQTLFETSPAPASDLTGLLADLDPVVRSGVETLLKDLIGQTKAYYAGSTDDGSFCAAATNYFRDARRLKPGRPVRPVTPPKRPTFSARPGRAAEGLRLGRVLHDLLAIDVEPAEGMIISGSYRYHLQPGNDRDGLVIERRSYDNRRWLATEPVFTSVEALAARDYLDIDYSQDAKQSRRPAADRATVIHPTKTVIEFGPLDAPAKSTTNRASQAAQQSIDDMNAEVAAAFNNTVAAEMERMARQPDQPPTRERPLAMFIRKMEGVDDVKH